MPACALVASLIDAHRSWFRCAQTSDNNALYGAFAVTLAIRGGIDVGIWVYNQQIFLIYSRWWRKDKSPLPEDNNLNRALRKEVLIYSTNGICK